MQEDRLPVSIITGFLGSGKTTLLNRLLRHPAMGESAVVVNEFGEVGIDNALLVASSDQVVLMESGCLCCTIRGDLIETLGELMAKRKSGAVPSFRRVVIETTGLADPAPILQALMSDLTMLNHFRLGQVVTVVDGYHGARTLDAQPEAVKQAAMADRLVLSKGDLVPRGVLERLIGRLRRLNPIAPVIEALQGDVDPGRLFGSAGFDIAEKTAEVRSWLAAEHGTHPHSHDRNRHDADIQAHAFAFDEPLAWEALAGWLDRLALEHGEDLLRVKGLVNVRGQQEPVVIQGVHHLFHPPSTLARWPDDDHRSRLVFIVRHLGRTELAVGAPQSTPLPVGPTS